MKQTLNIHDELLLNRISNGDESALTELYSLYWKPLFISSYNLLKNKEICEEIVQDVFIDFWNKKDAIEIKISLNSYLYACTRYKVFHQIKKQNTTTLPPELFESLEKRFQYATPETLIMHQELVNKIDEIINSLPPKCKEVYQLSRNEYLSHKEISDRLQISTKTVENHISKAIKVLKSSLGQTIAIYLIDLF